MTDKQAYAHTPAEGNFLWEAHYKSEYYDGDGISPVDERMYVLAPNYNEAVNKSKKTLMSRISKEYSGIREKLKSNEKIEVNFVALENLVAARDSSNDGRIGFYSTQKLKEVQLSLEDDLKKYRLGVCLIPIEE